MSSQDDNDGFDTGWTGIVPQNVEVDHENKLVTATHGEVELATGQEERPCCMCKSFEDVDPAKLIRHVISKGLTPRPDGKFETPIAKDFRGRKSMVLDPKGAGMCRRDVIVVEGLATCENFSPTKSISDFQRRMFKR
jgi:hypothetical protein